jgi:hypothetical protein
MQMIIAGAFLLLIGFAQDKSIVCLGRRFDMQMTIAGAFLLLIGFSKWAT